jgi:hypothetical protein
MSSVTFVHPEETRTVPILQAINKCSLFQKNVTLAGSPYTLQSTVSVFIFRQFISALEGASIEITNTNFTGLLQLSTEFGFEELSSKLSDFQPSISFKNPEEAETLERIAVLEERAQRSDRDIAILQREFATDFSRLTGEVSSLRSAMAGIQTLFGEVSALQTQISSLFPPSTPLPPSSASIPSFDSRIISDFPEIFAEFRGKQISLLWRGSRDGFEAKEFHGRCDGHSNTLTVILEADWNIFGAFTPVKWESRVWKGDESHFKADDSLKSWLFTLKNPDNLPPKRFVLKSDMKHRAISCRSDGGPRFNDIGVSDNCNTKVENFAHWFGSSYINDTGLGGIPGTNTFFAGVRKFRVKEIEVFEITD